jgi:hypothetical protein
MELIDIKIAEDIQRTFKVKGEGEMFLLPEEIQVEFSKRSSYYNFYMKFISAGLLKGNKAKPLKKAACLEDNTLYKLDLDMDRSELQVLNRFRIKYILVVRGVPILIHELFSIDTERWGQVWGIDPSLTFQADAEDHDLELYAISTLSLRSAFRNIARYEKSMDTIASLTGNQIQGDNYDLI